jgi:hypothetical protein
MYKRKKKGNNKKREKEERERIVCEHIKNIYYFIIIY